LKLHLFHINNVLYSWY